MNAFRKSEYYDKLSTEKHNSAGNIPPKLCPQETDWTCSIACIRTMLSGIEKNLPTEKEYVDKYNLKPGPHYSKQIKEFKILEDYEVVYGCDNPDITFDEIITMLENGYYIMLESMINYSHWVVLLAYLTVPTPHGMEKYEMLYYEPYYNCVKSINADEFIGVWKDGPYEKTKVEKDFIAIKGK